MKELPLRLQVLTLHVQYGAAKRISRLHELQRRQKVSGVVMAYLPRARCLARRSDSIIDAP
jgi:hypothetical protein